MISGRLDEAERSHTHALTIQQQLDDRRGAARSINALGLLALRHRRLHEAGARFAQSASIFAEVGDRRWEAVVRGNLAETHRLRGDIATALDVLQYVLPTMRGLNDHSGEGGALFILAATYRTAGRLDEARAAIDEALTIAVDSDNDVWLAHWLAELARIQLAQRRADEALVSSQRSAVIQRRLGDRSREATALDLSGQAYQQLERYDEAVDFHRIAASVHRELGDGWQLASALDHLAAALSQTGDPDGARECRREALAALADFDDPSATAMRERLSRTRPDP